MYYANLKANLMVENISQIKSGITIKANASAKISENFICAKKAHMLNLTNCTCKNGKYLESIADDSAVT